MVDACDERPEGFDTSQLEVLKLMLQDGMIPLKDMLNMRIVDSKWRDCVDEFAGRSHLSAYCRWAPTPDFPWIFKPNVRMTLPLTTIEGERFKEMAKHKTCPLIGGRLEMFLDKVSIASELFPSIQEGKANDLQVVMQHVKHLVINYRRDVGDPANFLKHYGGLLQICSPFLNQMTNLKTIMLLLDPFNVELINCLPNPEKLEGICTRSRELEKDGSDDWKLVLRKCNKSLKVLQCDVLTRGMEEALVSGDIVFETLYEFRTLVHHYTFNQDASFEPEPYYDGPTDDDFLENFACARTKQHFPCLARIGIPFIHRIWEHDWEQVFLCELVRMTKILDTLEVIEITVNKFLPPLITRDFPIPNDMLGCGGRKLKKLVVNARYTMDTLRWLASLARVWPSVCDIQLGGFRYIRENQGWFNVEKEAMCKNC